MTETKDLLDLIVEHQCAPSRGQARNLVKQGAVFINGKAHTDSLNLPGLKEADVVTVGKRRYGLHQGYFMALGSISDPAKLPG